MAGGQAGYRLPLQAQLFPCTAALLPHHDGAYAFQSLIEDFRACCMYAGVQGGGSTASAQVARTFGLKHAGYSRIDATNHGHNLNKS